LGNDLWLRERATETAVKTTDLSRKRMIVFATHGLMSNEISPGIDEPGLLLTLPRVATAQDDGFLSASEISRLKLGAEWVVLSACNTGAGTNPGADGLSGVARAFFLAGAKSLLVSHWPVWNDVSPRLTIGTLKRLRTNPAIGRGEALKQTMLSLMNENTGSPRFAHPAAWAPFTVVGETIVLR
jgi:CHAT domain-containing protein